jgi:hypothetical protein
MAIDGAFDFSNGRQVTPSRSVFAISLRASEDEIPVLSHSFFFGPVGDVHRSTAQWRFKTEDGGGPKAFYWPALRGEMAHKWGRAATPSPPPH